LEIIKGRTANVLANLFQVIATMKNLPSGYNRDLQETKGALIDSMETSNQCLDILSEAINKIKVNEDKMKNSLDETIFATHHALSMVKEGKPYKEAYKIVGEKLKSGSSIPKSEVKADFGDYKLILDKNKPLLRYYCKSQQVL